MKLTGSVSADLSRRVCERGDNGIIWERMCVCVYIFGFCFFYIL